MLKISNSVELIKKVISGQTSKTSSFNRYDPLPTNRPAHRYNAIDPKVAARFSERKLRESERLESQSLTMIRGALYACE